MRYLPYDRYKASRIDWLDKVPEHWTEVMLKRTWATCDYGISDSLDAGGAVRVLTMGDIENGRVAIPAEGSINDVAAEMLLKNGDLLFNRTNSLAHIGKVGLCKHLPSTPLTFASYLVRLRTNRQALPDFLNYLLNTRAFLGYVSSLALPSINQANLNPTRYGRIWIPLPPIAEQYAVAHFLDDKTVEIEALIAKKHALIEKLEEKRSTLISCTVTRGLPPQAARVAGLEPNPRMKPSEIEWLGEIPVHWQTVALRYLFKNLDHRRIPVAGEDRASMEKVYPYYGASGVIDSVEEYLFDETLILVAEDGANLLSRSTPLAFLATGKYWVNNHAHILKPLDGDIRYWAAVLETFDYTPLVTGAAQPKLTSERLGSIELPKPPAIEQRAIADFLHRESAKIDALVAKVEQAIERLQEYRTALITAAITGKIDVRTKNAELSVASGTLK